MNYHKAYLHLPTILAVLLLTNQRNSLFWVSTRVCLNAGVDSDLLHNCLLTGRLNELVHKKYKFGKTGYYEQFCTLGIDLDKHYLKNDSVEPLPIYDNDHCESCNTEGYITLGYREIESAPYCAKCFKLMCVNCYGGNDFCKNCLT